MNRVLSMLDYNVRKHLPDIDWLNQLISHGEYFLYHGRLPEPGSERFHEYVFRLKTDPSLAAYGFFADKALVKKYVATLIGEQYVTPTLYVSQDGAGLGEFRHEGRFVLKPTHMCGRILFGEGALTSAQVDEARKWLKESLFRDTREYQYRCLTPRVIIEPMLTCNGAIPPDYKFYVGNGQCFLVQVDRGRFGNNQTRDFYTPDWQRCDIKVQRENRTAKPDEPPLAPPAELPEMLGIAEKLGAPFDFARVDLYRSDQGVRFGEITLTPGNAAGRFYPEAMEEWAYSHIFPDKALRPSGHSIPQAGDAYPIPIDAKARAVASLNWPIDGAFAQ